MNKGENKWRGIQGQSPVLAMSTEQKQERARNNHKRQHRLFFLLDKPMLVIRIIIMSRTHVSHSRLIHFGVVYIYALPGHYTPMVVHIRVLYQEVIDYKATTLTGITRYGPSTPEDDSFPRRKGTLFLVANSRAVTLRGWMIEGFTATIHCM